ncbi:hypothetical protein [Ensifer sp. YR511]|uniref:hypothetical protein n=1 Tax=Ensifer sp. YR511 TaxID=1855294 RepID=UPI000B7E92DB|nr:hypothetical protein [Ensifer sp. YR511]
MNLFTSSELALAAGISLRNFNVLIEHGLAPPTDRDQSGKHSTRYWDQFGIGEMALTGALIRAGAELFTAARLSHVILDDFTSARGRLPSRLDMFLDKDYNDLHPKFPWTADAAEGNWADDDFWLHRTLRLYSDVYLPDTRLNGDMILEIADRRYVFTRIVYFGRIPNLGRVQPWGITDGNEPDVEYEIVGWERGREASLRHFSDLVDLSSMMDDPEKKTAAKELEDAWLKARRNALGLLRVNVSLAIRTAFDAIHESRAGDQSRRNQIEQRRASLNLEHELPKDHRGVPRS